MRKPQLSLTVITVTIVIAALFSTASCHKKAASEDTGYANENATTEQTFNDVQTISDQAATMPSGATLAYKTSATTGSPCATVTHSGNTITIDFGASDCMCKDGRNRRGKIIVNYTGAYTDAGSVHTITFDNFYQNDNKVTGLKTVTNMGPNAHGQPYFNVHIDGSVTMNGGGTTSTKWDRVRTWAEGYSTSDFADDVYEITGSGTLTRENGQVISMTISNSTPLVCALNCRWIEAGSVTFSVSTGQSRVLDYGDTPDCDDMATVTLGNGNVRNITLP